MNLNSGEKRAGYVPLHDFRSSDTPVVSEGNARKIVANQIDLVCVPQLTSAEGRLAAQNGGYFA